MKGQTILKKSIENRIKQNNKKKDKLYREIRNRNKRDARIKKKNKDNRI